MAQVSVIARPGKFSTADKVIQIHAVKTENHELTNTVTDNPVEKGFNVSDHSRPNPEKITMECLVSNTPISRKQQTEAVRSGQYTFQSTSEQAGAIGDTGGVAQQTWKDLKEFRDKGEILTVVTTLDTFESMAIESISLPRVAKDYDALRFSITFKRIRVVKNKLTKNVVSKDSRAQAKKKAGATTTKDTDSMPKSDAAKTKDYMSDSNNPKVSGTGGLFSR